MSTESLGRSLVWKEPETYPKCSDSQFSEADCQTFDNEDYHVE